MNARVAQFQLFVYGTLQRDARAHELLNGCASIGSASVPGTLYDIDGQFPALVLAGSGRVEGELWRCPAERLSVLDRYEDAGAGLFRRVAIRIGELACWTYVAGPALARRLTPDRLIPSGVWR